MEHTQPTRLRKLLRTRERGAILPLIAIGMLTIIGVAGFAIDSSHMFVNVTRLQNGLDAAALSAAKTLNSSNGNQALATAHGTEAFGEHLEGELGGGTLTIGFEYSDTLNPFTPTGVGARYARATVANHNIPIWFARVLPGVGNEATIGTTAVAGPIPLNNGAEVCDIAPVVMCGDATDTDATDGTLFGLDYGNNAPVQCLKLPSGNKPWDELECGEQPAEDIIGPGNFLLARIACPGGNCVREAFAGEGSACLSDSSTIPTEPGNTVGPVFQGVNTRFDEYKGAGLNRTDHPPDLVVGAMRYTEYLSRYAGPSYDNTYGVAQRRIIAVPIADCSGTNTGQSDLPLLGFGCYFLTEPIDKGGPNSVLKGQLVVQCETGGKPSANPTTTNSEFNTFKILLYNDPGNDAS